MFKKFMVFVSLIALQAAAVASEQKEENGSSSITISMINDPDLDFKTAVSIRPIVHTLKQEAKLLLTLPQDVIGNVVFYLDDSSLLHLFTTSKRAAAIVDNAFYERSSIKLPFSCLKDQDIKHPYPHKNLYFLRKLLWDTLNPHISKTSIYKNAADFCKNWKYIGEEFFRIFGDDASFTDKEKLLPNIILASNKIINNNNDNQDLREIKLWLYLYPVYTEALANRDLSNLENNLIKEMLSVASGMSALEKKEIACTYVNSLGYYFLNKKKLDEARQCFEFSAQLKNSNAQHGLGIISIQEEKIDAAKDYFMKAARQGHKNARFNLGTLLYNEGNIKGAQSHFQLLADGGDADAQYISGIISRDKGHFLEAKNYFIQAANQGKVDAHNELGVIFEREGGIQKAKYHYQLAADKGLALARCSYAYILYNEGNIERSKQYLRLAADQGHAGAQYNVAHLLFTEKNFEESKTYYKLAAEQGLAQAKAFLKNWID